MSRPLRIEFPDALYHITSRGDRREDIYDDDADRNSFLDIFADTIDRFNWVCYAYCLMSNHYHLLICQWWLFLSADRRLLFTLDYTSLE